MGSTEVLIRRNCSPILRIQNIEHFQRTQLVWLWNRNRYEFFGLKSFLKLKIVTQGKADITIKDDNGELPSTTIGRGSFPSNGKAGSTIMLNLDAYKTVPFNFDKKGNPIQYTANKWKHNLIHETGHNIGFGHTDQEHSSLRRIPGTANKDKNSILNSGISNFKKGLVKLSNNDIKALIWLYSGDSGRCKGK